MKKTTLLTLLGISTASCVICAFLPVEHLVVAGMVAVGRLAPDNLVDWPIVGIIAGSLILLALVLTASYRGYSAYRQPEAVGPWRRSLGMVGVFALCVLAGAAAFGMLIHMQGLAKERRALTRFANQNPDIGQSSGKRSTRVFMTITENTRTCRSAGASIRRAAVCTVGTR